MSVNIFKGIRSGLNRGPETDTPSNSNFVSSQPQRTGVAAAVSKKPRLGFLKKNTSRSQLPPGAFMEPQPIASKDVPQDQQQYVSSQALQPLLKHIPSLDTITSDRAYLPSGQTWASERDSPPSHMNRTATIEKPHSYDTYSPCTTATFLHDADSSETQRAHSLVNGHDTLQTQQLVRRAESQWSVLQSPRKETMGDGSTIGPNQYRRLSGSIDRAYISLDQHMADAHFIAQLENEVHTLKNALRASNTEVEQQKKEASNKHQQMLKAQDMLGEQIVKREQEKVRLENEIEKLKHEHEIQRHNETQKLHKENEANKASYEERLRVARQEEEKRYEQTISSLRLQLEEEHWKWDTYVREVKEANEAHIRRLEASFDDQMKTQYERYLQQMQQEKEKHERTILEHRSTVARLKLEGQHEERRLREQLEAEQERLQEEQRRREKELKRQQAQLTKKYTHETFQLRTVNEELKQGLFHRTHFKGLKDRDLANLFRSIAGQVQDFANVEWDGRRTLAWPFDEHQLFDIHGENTRKLKKQIVQNTLWVLLYSHIFASPFKILGSEGEDLDRDWIDIHKPNASSLKWPEVSEDAEKRRYETAKSILAMMKPSVRLSGDDLRLKNACDRSISELLDALHHALGKVSTLEDGQAKMLESLVRLCARTWIEFCAQPYRLVVSLPDGSGDMLSEPGTKERALILVLSPQLKRYGNSQGEHLASGEVIPGCQAANVSYSVR